MKKSRYTDEQIAFALKQAETGTPVAEVIRRMGISEQTYRWKKVYGGLGVGELRRLKQLEDENRQLKQLVALRTSVWTSTSCRTSWQKSSDAWTTARARRARPGVPRRKRAAQLLGAGRRAVVGALHLAQAGSDSAGDAHPRSGGDANALWLFPDLHPAAQGGMSFADRSRALRTGRV